jgi:hypothetical protein
MRTSIPKIDLKRTAFGSMRGLREAFQSAAAHSNGPINAPTTAKKDIVYWVTQSGNRCELHWCSIIVQIANGTDSVLRFSNKEAPCHPPTKFWPFRILQVTRPIEINLALADFSPEYRPNFKRVAEIMSGRCSELDWALLQHGESGNYWSEAAEQVRHSVFRLARK